MGRSVAIALFVINSILVIAMIGVLLTVLTQGRRVAKITKLAQELAEHVQQGQQSENDHTPPTDEDLTFKDSQNNSFDKAEHNSSA